MKQKIQHCDVCDSPTDRCEDDALIIGSVIVCEECFVKQVPLECRWCEIDVLPYVKLCPLCSGILDERTYPPA